MNRQQKNTHIYWDWLRYSNLHLNSFSSAMLQEHQSVTIAFIYIRKNKTTKAKTKTLNQFQELPFDSFIPFIFNSTLINSGERNFALCLMHVAYR